MTRSGVEQRRLTEVANEYRTKGYEVMIEPAPGQIPDWLGAFRPDLVALRGDDRVIVEVKSNRSLRGEDALRSLAERVESQPGWRLELVLTRSPRKRHQSLTSPLLPRAQIVEYVAAARALLSHSFTVPAFLVGWMAFEIAFRHVLDAAGVDPNLSQPAAVLKTLVSLGYLAGATEQKRLEQLWDLRNQLAHGYSSAFEVSRDDVLYLLALCQELATVPVESAESNPSA